MEHPQIYKGHTYFKDNVPVYLNITGVMTNKIYRMHSHDFIEIAYVNTGSGLHQVENTEHAVSIGDLSIINTNIPHKFISNNEANPLTIFNCIFIPEFIDYSLLSTVDFKSNKKQLFTQTASRPSAGYC